MLASSSIINPPQEINGFPKDPFPFLIRSMSPSAIYISDPDMLASKLVEQEYLQSLGKIFLLVNSYNKVHNKMQQRQLIGDQ